MQVTLLGIAAVLSACCGIASMVFGVRKERRAEHDAAMEECRKRLQEARKESEQLAAELHELRMKEIEREGGRVEDAVNHKRRWTHLDPDAHE